ncbi:MAG: alpha,alpha-trehalase [Betaproteobacteria bacterium HGW-Betaproteobacteria-21]|nr:MAG: alpha,alpha-trehalase [Betaproteobacteria bacterium HGW-Betaproteobacteria-21]
MKDKHPQTTGALFQAVQLARVFTDSKTFPDCVARESSAVIEQHFRETLDAFVRAHFDLPRDPPSSVLAPAMTLAEHIDRLWTVLTRPPSATSAANDTLIGLPHDYVVPGGRFREIFYWDSYFTSVGLIASGRLDLVVSMIRNFASLIDRFGFVPNGNRAYFLGRSQPPTFGLMLELLEQEAGFEAIRPFLASLEAEHKFWMSREPATYDGFPIADRRTVLLGPDLVLNRYWDDHDGPREESFAEDVELVEHAAEDRRCELFRNLRAGAESGWDFSSRWLAAGQGLESIRTTELIPIDLNCLLYRMEVQLGRWLAMEGETRAEAYAEAAARRKAALNSLCWSDGDGWWFDYDWKAGRRRESWTLAGSFPLHTGVVEGDQADAMAATVERRFLQPGGVVTTLTPSSEQWDWPNGWAPLQWMVVSGLLDHGHERLAGEIAERFVALAERVYQRTGKLMEKYDVCDMSLDAGGGEYPVQDGFGWTNGVVRAFVERFGGGVA